MGIAKKWNGRVNNNTGNVPNHVIQGTSKHVFHTATQQKLAGSGSTNVQRARQVIVSKNHIGNKPAINPRTGQFYAGVTVPSISYAPQPVLGGVSKALPSSVPPAQVNPVGKRGALFMINWGAKAIRFGKINVAGRKPTRFGNSG